MKSLFKNAFRKEKIVNFSLNLDKNLNKNSL